MKLTRLLTALSSASIASACASAPTPPSPTDPPTPPLGMVSAGELTPPDDVCDLVRPLPSSDVVPSFAEGLASVGVAQGGTCEVEPTCKVVSVFVFPTDDSQVEWVGFDANDGRHYLVKNDAPSDGTCGIVAPAHTTLAEGSLRAVQRTFGDCQSAEPYRDWLVFEAAQGGLAAALWCQGSEGSLVLEPGGRLALTCLGRTFRATPDELMQCYAG